MKIKLQLSFKRVKSRPANINLQKINRIRSLFAVKLAKEISTDTLLINIDDTSINRDVKTNYSWGYKGETIEAKNSSFSGSISWILAIWSNGSWIWLLANQTIDSNCFVWFIKILNSWLNLNNKFGYHETIFLLDNCAVHKSKLTMKLLKKLSHKVYYLPAYSPELAPVEMCFSLFKRSLSESCKQESINLSFKQNFIKIHRSLKVLTSKSIKNMYGRLFHIVNEYLRV